MTIILDLRFAMLDRAPQMRKIAARERKEHKRGCFRLCVPCVLLRPFCLRPFHPHFHRGQMTVKVVKLGRGKSRIRNWLMVNAVKPSQSKSHHRAGLTGFGFSQLGCLGHTKPMYGA